MQLSQAGTFVFVVKDDVATVRPVKVERTVDGESVDRSPASQEGKWSSPTASCCFRTEPG